MENEYYKNYKGPNLTLAQIWKESNYKINITEYIQLFYGNNNNWKGKLYKFKDIFPGKDHKYKFYVEFKSKDGKKHWFNGNVGEPEQYFNPPLASPIDENLNVNNELNINIDKINIKD